MTPQATTVDRSSSASSSPKRHRKASLLIEVLKTEKTDRVLVFTRTKHGADKVVRGLQKPASPPRRSTATRGRTSASASLTAFRDGRLRTLIATDIAARGIDVDGVSHVVNYDLPNVPESYVHRIGRTARAGAEGVAISFCDHEERRLSARHRAADPHDHPGNRPAHRRADGPCGFATGRGSPRRPTASWQATGAVTAAVRRVVMAVPAITATGPVTVAMAAKTVRARTVTPRIGRDATAGEPSGIGNVTFLKRPNEPRRSAGHRPR